MGIDQSQLINARAQQGMRDVQKAHDEGVKQDITREDGRRDPKREENARKILDETKIVLPGDIVMTGHSEKGKPVIDGPMTITNKQRIQNVLSSPAFISEGWDKIKPIENDMELPLAMLGQSVLGGGKSLSPRGEKVLSHEVAANQTFRNELEQLISENSEKDSFDTGEMKKNYNDAGNSIGLSLGGATIQIKGTKMQDGNWMIEFGGKDAYDYSEWKNKQSLANMANNWAYVNQGLGIIKPYPVKFSGAFIYPAK